VHFKIPDLKLSGADGVNIARVVKGIRNNNAFGRDRNENEILIGGAAAGVLVFAKPKPGRQPKSDVLESI
jgi:hypothetical protein